MKAILKVLGLQRTVASPLEPVVSRDEGQLAELVPFAAEISVERFIFFHGFMHLIGRVHDPIQPVVRVQFCVEGERYDAHLLVDRFELRLDLGVAFEMREPALMLTHANGSRTAVEHIGQPESHAGRGHKLFPVFLSRVAALPSGNFLEIGSRARSGITRREHIPPTWQYTGFDIVEGENVTVVGDAHELSTLLPPNHYNAVMALSVFEHLLMPWKVAIEMNRVMAPGGFALIFTHQCFPLHDEPWDYLRFSTYSWPAFFNESTGFRIIEVGAAEPVYVVGQRWNPGVHHRTLPGMTVSSVLIEKVCDTQLSWPVKLRDVVDTDYPG